MTDHFFLRIMIQLKMFGFYFVFLNFIHHHNTRVNATMLFFQFILYLSSFVGILKKEIPGAPPELWHLKSKFSPYILKFKTKHDDNLFNLNCSTVPRSCLYFMQARVDWVRIIFGTQVIKKKNGRLGPCFQTIFLFFMIMVPPTFWGCHALSTSWGRSKDVLKWSYNAKKRPRDKDFCMNVILLKIVSTA